MVTRLTKEQLSKHIRRAKVGAKKDGNWLPSKPSWLENEFKKVILLIELDIMCLNAIDKERDIYILLDRLYGKKTYIEIGNKYGLRAEKALQIIYTKCVRPIIISTR